MGVPEEVRRVPRPKNTVVVENKEDGPRHYAVRARAGVAYVKGGNPRPINGNVIGHIYEGRFVPVSQKPGADGPSALSYGSAALVRRESGDILDDLMETMDIGYAVMAYVAAMLKVVKPGIKSKRMSTEYARTFACVWHPGLPMSKNSMTELYRRIGMDETVRAEFAGRRLARVSETGHLVVDGMLKEDNSTVNDLSGFSFKSRIKGIKNISVVYAYDLERREIVCSEVFPGGFIDAAAYARFVRDNGITRGILVTDKGFPPSKLEKEFAERPELHFLTPLKRNDSRIRDNGMTEYQGVLKDAGGDVLYKKAAIRGGRFLYSFKDPGKAAAEEVAYLEKARRGKGGFSNGEYARRRAEFGTIVFLSDQDLAPEQAYACYSDRWLIELVFRYFKNDMDIRTSDAQDDFAVIGEEFVNTVASCITCRLFKLFRDRGLLDDMSFGDVMDDLSGVWRRSDSKDVLPDREDGSWVHPFEYAMDVMVELGLCAGEVSTEASRKRLEKLGVRERRPRGRPRKNPPEPDGPKRPRGRPRKNPPAESVPKRPRGRPRKNPR